MPPKKLTGKKKAAAAKKPAARKTPKKAKKATAKKATANKKKPAPKKKNSDTSSKSQNKTQPDPKKSVDAFLKAKAGDKHKDKIEEANKLLVMLSQLTGNSKPVVWGNSFVGCGQITYTSASTGRSGEWPPLALSITPKGTFTVYTCPSEASKIPYLDEKDVKNKLGKAASCGKGCLHFPSVDKIEGGMPALRSFLEKRV